MMDTKWIRLAERAVKSLEGINASLKGVDASLYAISKGAGYKIIESDEVIADTMREERMNVRAEA